MLSYHNDINIKEKYTARFAKHRELDQVIQGTGFSDGRGCFVGCTLDNYDHDRFPIELGWPVWLARLADVIFEGLPKEDAPAFGTDLLDAVPVGVDLEPVRHQLAIMRLSRLITLQQSNVGKHKNIDDALLQTIAALELVKKYHESELGYCGVVDRSAAARSAESAESAAESAAWSARSAARSAAESAAESAAWSAKSAWSAALSAKSAAWSAAESAAWSAKSAAKSAAESAAESAAWSARSAARSAAESAAYQQERNDLLTILRNM